jgi:hypothetical protein
MRNLAKIIAIVCVFLASAAAFAQSYPLGNRKGFLVETEFSIKISNKIFGKTEEDRASKVLKISNLKRFFYSASHVPAYGGESGGLTIFNDEPSINQQKVGYCNVGNLDTSLSIPVQITESTIYNRDVVISGEPSHDETVSFPKPEPGEVFIYGDESLEQNGVTVVLNCDYKTKGITSVGFTAQHYGIVRLNLK